MKKSVYLLLGLLMIPGLNKIFDVVGDSHADTTPLSRCMHISEFIGLVTSSSECPVLHAGKTHPNGDPQDCYVYVMPLNPAN